MRKPTWEENEEQNILKIELKGETPLWDPLSTEFSSHEHSMFNYRACFIRPNTPARRQYFINSVTSHADDAVNVIDHDSYTTVLESFIITSSLQVLQVNTKMVSGLDHLVLAKKCDISPKKALITTCHTTQHGVPTVLQLSLSRQFMTNNHQFWYRRLPHNVYHDTLLPATVSKRGNRCAQIFFTDFGLSHSFPMMLKIEAHEVSFLFFQHDEVPPAINVTMPKKWSCVRSTGNSMRHHVT